MPDKPTLNPPYYWGPASIYKLPTKEFLAQIPAAYQIGTAEEIAKRRVGYVPSYFEHPQNVVEAYNKVQSLPKGTSAPDWLDTTKLEQAYQYLKFANGDKPWPEWSYLNRDDVLGRSLLQSLGTPPVAVMSPTNAATYANADAVLRGEMNWTDLAPDVRAQLLADPGFDIAKYPWQLRSQILADPKFDWSRVPAWQRIYYGVMSSPALPLVMAALPAGLIGYAAAGPVGGVIGAGIGTYAGWRASQGAYDPTKEIGHQPTFLGNVFAGLNWSVEQEERIFGVMKQIEGAIRKPEEHPIEEIFANLPAAYGAGLSYFEQWPAMLTEGKEVIIGRAEPVELTTDVWDRLEAARKQIEAGANPRMLMLEMQQYAGAQASDLLLQIVADPLNALPWMQKEVVGKVLEVTGHPTAAEAMGGARGIVEGIKTYAARVQTGEVAPGFKYDEMSGLSRFFAGITYDAESKPVIRAGKFATTGLLEEPAINYLRTMTPESRARVGLALASDNVMAMMTMFDRPEDVVAFWDQIRAGDYTMAAEVSARFVQSPEFYTVLPAIKNFTMDELIGVWQASRPNAAVVERIAGLLGETGENVVKDLATPEAAARMSERVRTLVETSTDAGARIIKDEIATGRFTVADLIQAGKIFTGDSRAPLTAAQWKAMTTDAMTTHFADWAKDFFHLAPDSIFFRAAAMMKSAQSILLLGFNPAYAINNELNNMVTRVATGNFGYMLPGQMADFIDRLGITPYRLREGVGMAGEVEARAAGRIISDALRTDKGVIANMHNFLRSTSNKLGVFSNLSRWMEKVEGANAYVSSIKRAWGQIWRMDKGYTRMEPGLVSALEAVHPGASEIIYRAIQAGMNQGEIERIVVEGTKELHTRGMINSVAQAMGIDSAQAMTMLDQIGVLDDLDNRLAGVKSEAGIRAAFSASAKKAQDWIDVRLADEYATRAQHVTNRISTEGWTAVGDIYIDAEMKIQERWLEHYNAFEEAFAQLDVIENPVQRSNILESTYREQAREWARVNQMELSTYRGLAEGLSLGELPEARDFLARKAEIQNAWGDAYKFRMDETAKYTDRFKGDWNDPARITDRATLQKRINTKFEATFKAVQKNEKAMGEVFAAQFRTRFGDAVGKLAGQYWKEITDFRGAMWQEMQTFRDSLVGMTYDQRRAASAQFWHERYPALINELEYKKMNGATEIERTITGRKPPPGAPPVAPAPEPVAPPPTTPVGGAPAAAITPEQANIFTIANEFGISSADESGRPVFGANNHILSVVRKYGGDEGAAIKSFADLADKPDLVRAAFEQRRIEVNRQMPMAGLASPEKMAEYEAVQATARALTDNPELTAAALAESETLKAPRSENAEVQAAKAVENVVAEPSRWAHIENTHIALLDPATRDALMYKAWDMKTLVEVGENRTRLFEDGAFIGATSSSYPDWYGPLKRNKGDVVFALEALSKGLDKPEQALYRSLKGLAAELLTSDPALLQHWDWAKAFGAEGDILFKWEQSVAEMERTIQGVDINDPFADVQINYQTLTSLVDDLPTEAYDRIPEGRTETYRDFVSRVWDEAEVKRRAITDRRTMLETLIDADRAGVAADQFKDMVMTREVFREQLVENMGLKPEEADATVAITDARAQAWAKMTGHNPAEWYADRLAGVVRGGEGELFQIEPISRRMTPTEISDYARALVRAGEDELRRAVKHERYHADRVAILDEAHKLNPQMAENVAKEFSALLQEGPTPAMVKGAINFLEDGRAVIHALEGKDVSTVVHEIGHVFRRELVAEDLAIVEKWADVKEGVWNTTAEEKFARGFEQYLAEGKAPTLALARIFEQFKVWMLEIYKAITGSAIDVNLTDDVRRVFDRMLGQEAPTGKAYDGLRPGTPEWMAAWRAHPELQSEMAAITITLQDAVRAKATEIAPAPVIGGILYAAGDIVRLADGTQHTIVEVRPDATLVLDNGQTVSAAAVQRVAAQESLFGEKPPTQQTTLFQNVDPRTPLGYYEQQAGWLPEGAVMDEAWSHYVQPLLDGMQNEAVRQYREPTFSIGELDAPTQQSLTKYLNQKKGELATSKLAAVRYGETMRDFALLNYNRRYGFDKYLDVVMPYQFWYTRTMLNWGMRALDRPVWYANYARLNMMQNRYANNLPERMRGKIRIPAPWLPDWMGDELYIDPKRAIFPFTNMITPFEMMMKDNNYQQVEAERILQGWAQDGSVPQAELQEAWQTRQGATWEKALAQAKINRQSEISNPLDFLSILLGPAWYLSTPAKALGLKIPYINPQGGGPETISELPLTRTARAAQAVTTGTWAEPIGQLIGLLGKPETWIRKATGLPEYGEYGDYYVKRQIANMVGDGLISVQDAEQAMIERKGDIYDQARKRVELELAMRVPGAAATYAALHGGIAAGAGAIPVSLFGAQILPAGELKYRGLYEKWNAAWDAYDAGDTSAINNFFNDHPEYEAYLAKNKDEGELLRSFLIGQIWDGYMAMDKDNRRVLLAQMPQMFKQSFLDKETRSYDAIDTETLAMWARVFKGAVPKTEVTQTVTEMPQYQMPQLLEIPMPLQNALNAYYLARTQNFPNINEIQALYYDLPTDQRRKILTLYPQLPAYWDWKAGYLAAHPEVAQFIDSDTMTAILSDEQAPVGMTADQAGKILRYYRSDYLDETPARTYTYYMANASDTLKMQLLDYALRGTMLGDGAMKELVMIWEDAGKPQGTIDNWVNNLLIPTMP
jgi:hypothetical protein